MRVSKHGPGRRAVGLRRSPPADKEAQSQRDKEAITRRGKTRSSYSSSQRVAPARPPQLTLLTCCVYPGSAGEAVSGWGVLTGSP